MSARDYFRKIGAAIAKRAVISVNDDDRAALAWKGGLRRRLIVLSQKVARFDFENQLFEKVQDWRARC